MELKVCEELQATLNDLTKLQVKQKMEKLSSTVKRICKLENYICGKERFLSFPPCSLHVPEVTAPEMSHL